MTEQQASEQKILQGVRDRLNLASITTNDYQQGNNYSTFRISILKLQAAINLLFDSGVIEATEEEEIMIAKVEQERIMK